MILTGLHQGDQTLPVCSCPGTLSPSCYLWSEHIRRDSLGTLVSHSVPVRSVKTHVTEYKETAGDGTGIPHVLGEANLLVPLFGAVGFSPLYSAASIRRWFMGMGKQTPGYKIPNAWCSIGIYLFWPSSIYGNDGKRWLK